MGTITIEIDEKHALVRHIESLQATLTKRNLTIERLTAQIEAGEESPLIQDAYNRGRKAGWAACATHLVSVTDDAARALGTVRKTAWRTYLEPDRVEREPSDAGSDG